ncbi:uncharacterized protein TM35_000101940 [Trypanosoma theileri]|uniref:Uncharacterized protein n=1 Tax=Trypanosoma theileri TaxID=67003 RepID=A0A1X0NYZ4_9TRYP|nr:uncharacterized protein TM35_000101940 [Trypanosoma theileri]ORC89926.1 hypothetical protein TM35_000101940 [Trypanosoma theileri]
MEAEINEKSAAETNTILFALAECCKRYAVGRNTVRSVRVMFTESEMALRQAADPSAYRELTRGELRRRVEREVKDVEETRHAVVEERRKVRVLKKREKRSQMKSGGSSDDDNDNDNGEEEEGSAAGRRGGKKTSKHKKVTKESSSDKSKKKQPRNTKRKKYYTLTKKDLYGDE